MTDNILEDNVSNEMIDDDGTHESSKDMDVDISANGSTAEKCSSMEIPVIKEEKEEEREQCYHTFEDSNDMCSVNQRQNRLNTDFYQRFVGHCNLKTDIKEATFFGEKYICSGSDDGRCFIWEKKSGKLVNVLNGVGMLCLMCVMYVFV